MSDDSQLLALQKACEAKEQEALLRKKEIERVVQERQQRYDEVWRTREMLLERLRKLTDEDRAAALRSRDSGSLQTIAEYSKRIRKDVEAQDAVLGERTQELKMAQERQLLAEEEHVSARMETRRVEKLLEERNIRAIVHGSAVEEAALDELMTSRRDERE